MEEVQAVIRQRSLLKRLFGHFKCSKAELSFSIGLGSFLAAVVGPFLESFPLIAQYYPTEWAQPLICLSVAPFCWVVCMFMFNKGWIDLNYDQAQVDSIETKSLEIDWSASYGVSSISETSVIIFKP